MKKLSVRQTTFVVFLGKISDWLNTVNIKQISVFEKCISNILAIYSSFQFWINSKHLDINRFLKYAVYVQGPMHYYIAPLRLECSTFGKTAILFHEVLKLVQHTEPENTSIVL